MNNPEQFPPKLIARAISLLLAGRVHFPKDKVGFSIMEDEQFVVFRQMVVDPAKGQPETPGVVFRVYFHFAKFSAETNRWLSLIPILFIAAQPGFRSKTWLTGQETGMFQGLYEFDTVEDAEKYWLSFPLKLMKKRAVPESLTSSISKVETVEPDVLKLMGKEYESREK